MTDHRIKVAQSADPPVRSSGLKRREVFQIAAAFGNERVCAS
jgi:hypothetical protein